MSAGKGAPAAACLNRCFVSSLTVTNRPMLSSMRRRKWQSPAWPKSTRSDLDIKVRNRAFSDCSCFLHSCSSRRSFLSRTWPLVDADTWLLRRAWDSVDPYVQIICENTKGLDSFPDEGFAQQIDVTVAAALLIEWAARKKAKNTAVRVLQQLISGEMGSAEDLDKTRKRLNKITTNIKKEIKTNAEYKFPPESIQARLSSPFRLAKGDRYPRLLTPSQAKEGLCPTPGEKPACSLLHTMLLANTP